MPYYVGARGRRLQGRARHLLPQRLPSRPGHGDPGTDELHDRDRRDGHPELRLRHGDGAAADELDRVRQGHRDALPVGAPGSALPQGGQPRRRARARGLLDGHLDPVPLVRDAAGRHRPAGRLHLPAGQQGRAAGSQIGVTVAVFFPSNTGFRSSVTFTQIEQSNAASPQITSEAKATTVRVSSARDANTACLEQLGVINLSGELFTGSRTVATASAGTAGNSLGEQINGATRRTSSPRPTSIRPTSARATRRCPRRAASTCVSAPPA